MRTIEIPKFFHEFFGQRITVLELILILLFSIGMSFFILFCSYSELSGLGIWKVIVIIILTFDISGGVIANFTLSTNNHYKSNPRARFIFILMHVQPIILALVIGNYFVPSIYIWIYTIISAFIVNALIHYPAQKTVAAVFLAGGLGSMLMIFTSIPKYLLVIWVFYLIKVIFSFAVDHYAKREI